jgi:exodeoxyribonuclease VII large subunit
VDVTLADLAADVRAATPTAAGELCVPERRLLREALGEVEARLARAGGVALERRRRALEKLEARLSPHDPRRMLARDRQRIDELVGRAQTVMRARLAAARRELDRLDGRRAGAHPATRLGEHRARLAELGVRLERAGRRALDLRRRALGEAAARLGAMSPLAVLERGYALARTPDGTVVTDAAQVAPGDELELRLARGALDVRVERVREREREKEKK